MGHSRLAGMLVLGLGLDLALRTINAGLGLGLRTYGLGLGLGLGRGLGLVIKALTLPQTIRRMTLQFFQRLSLLDIIKFPVTK